MSVCRKYLVCVAIVVVFGVAGSCFARSLEFNETEPKFGLVPIGESSAPKTLLVSNVGHVPVLISDITISDSYTQSSNCNMWLAEGSTCLIFITFTPQVTGPVIGKLSVTLATAEEQEILSIGVGLSTKNANSTKDTNMVRTNNDEEKAQELLNDKRYTFKQLLEGDQANVANAENFFSLTKDTQTKMRIASILLSLGVRDQTYFDFLSGEARKVLTHDHDMPWPLLYDDQKQQKALNPALNDWCKAHGLGFWDMDKVEFYEMPVPWYDLAAAGDSRAYDLLLKGLHSQNLAIVALAAEGLAKLQDPRAIDELIAIGQQVPGEALGGIVRSLIYFDDPKAQAAAKMLLPEKQKSLLDFYRSQKKASGMRALFPW